MKPTVSIGMCLKNCESSLRKAIDSVLEQDFRHELMEIIFVDDGSEDRTLSIILDYVSRINIKAKVFHSEWKGLGSARNLVVNNSSGDYIIWVDGDQILTRDYVRKQVEFMELNPTVGIATGTLEILPEENPVLSLEIMSQRAMIEYAHQNVWKAEKLPGTGGAIFRVEAIRQVNGFDENIKGVGEDQEVARRVKDAGWLIRRIEAIIYEKHGGMSTWKCLWDKYFWYGYGGETLYRKRRDLFSLPRMVPPAGFIAGFLYSPTAYKFFHRKVVFLLPFHFAFKMIAWCLGFAKSQIDHAKRQRIVSQRCSSDGKDQQSRKNGGKPR